jgi:hypothetical protein
MLICAIASDVVATLTWIVVESLLPSFAGEYETASDPLFGAASAFCARARLAKTATAAMALFIVLFILSFGALRHL